MQENMRKYIIPGLVHFMAYPETMKGEGPIEEMVRHTATDDYFDAVELTWIKDDIVLERVKKIIDVSGMRVYYGAAPRLLLTGLNPNAIDENDRMKAVDTLKAGIDEASRLGALGFSFLSGKWSEATKAEAFGALVKTTVELCEYAKKKDIPKVVLEIFDHDVDKCSLIGPVELAKDFAEKVCAKVDNFGLMVDLSHLPLLRESAEASLTPIKDYIVHAHIGNAVVVPGLPAYGDAHPRFGFPGSANGVDQIVEYLRVLMDIGYLNDTAPHIVSFEVKPYGDDEDSELVIANAKRALNLAWAKL